MQLWTEAKIAGEEQEGLRKRLLSLVLVLESIIPDKLLVEKQLSLLKYPALPVVLFSFYVRILVSVIKEFKSFFIIFQTRPSPPPLSIYPMLLRVFYVRCTVLRAETVKMSEVYPALRVFYTCPLPNKSMERCRDR